MQILTLSGVRLDPWNLKPEDVRVEDISGALSKICRYTGHCKEFYSVAQHSVVVAKFLQTAGEDTTTCLQGLYHDASEAYLTDLNTPVKSHLPTYKEAEKRAEVAIFEYLGLPFPWGPRVKDADYASYLLERRYLMPNDYDEDDIACNVDAVNMELNRLQFNQHAQLNNEWLLKRGLLPSEAHDLFEDTAEELWGNHAAASL